MSASSFESQFKSNCISIDYNVDKLIVWCPTYRHEIMDDVFIILLTLGTITIKASAKADLQILAFPMGHASHRTTVSMNITAIPVLLTAPR